VPILREKWRPSAAVAEKRYLDADSVEYGEKQVIQRRFPWKDEVAARDNAPSAVAGPEDRQVCMVVAVAVTDPTAVDNHDAVQKRLAAFTVRLELAQ
jgi:hypothetical protein